MLVTPADFARGMLQEARAPEDFQEGGHYDDMTMHDGHAKNHVPVWGEVRAGVIKQVTQH